MAQSAREMGRGIHNADSRSCCSDRWVDPVLSGIGAPAVGTLAVPAWVRALYAAEPRHPKAGIAVLVLVLGRPKFASSATAA